MFAIDGDKLPRSARSGVQRRRARGQAWRALGQAFCQPTLTADWMTDNQSSIQSQEPHVAFSGSRRWVTAFGDRWPAGVVRSPSGSAVAIDLSDEAAPHSAKVLWQLPEATADRPHGVKYRLYLGREGKARVRYDNETGKGDHRHVGPGEAEQPYAFTTVEQLLKDFLAECELLGWRKGDEADSR
jgi:hypothetical protein